MYGSNATELIRNITRDHGDIIPEYQYKLVEQVMRENSELYAENLKTSQSTENTGGDGAPMTSPDNNVNGHSENGVGPTGSCDKTNVAPTNHTDQTSENNVDKDNDNDVYKDEPPAKDNMSIGEKEIMVMQVRHTAKLWNKRCIIAYHYERLRRLKQLRWDYGNVLPRDIVKNLSKEELEWFTKYNDNLFNYMNSLNGGEGIDLTLYSKPPKKLYVKVRCVQDYGQFDLEDGQPVMLKKDSIHYLPLSQCEKLIQQGVLKQTS